MGYAYVLLCDLHRATLTLSAGWRLEEEQMSTLKIIRKYGHKSAGDERFQWEQRSVVVKEKEQENEDLLAQAQAAFTEAMNETGAWAMMKSLPTDKEYIPVSEFKDDASEILVFQPVVGG